MRISLQDKLFCLFDLHHFSGNFFKKQVYVAFQIFQINLNLEIYFVFANDQSPVKSEPLASINELFFFANLDPFSLICIGLF